MVKVDSFDIRFGNTEDVYFAGQEINGQIVIELKEPKQINEILLELKGRAKTYWTKHSGKSRKHCSESEPYFLEQFNTDYTRQFPLASTVPQQQQQQSSSPSESPTAALNGRAGKLSMDDATVRTIPAGRHEIPFAYTLPKTLPSSFEGDYGYVRYTCKAILERPWDFDIGCRKAFTIVGIEDMNSTNNHKQLDPVHIADSHTDVRFCCRKQGKVEVELELAKTAFTAGEQLVLSAQIKNQSQRSLRHSAVSLKQHVNYRAKTFSGSEYNKSTSKTIVKLERGEIGPNGCDVWRNETLIIPPVPPALAKCKIIQVAYTLEVEVDTGVVAKCPITVCTIPHAGPSALTTQLRNTYQAALNNGTDNSDTVEVTMGDDVVTTTDPPKKKKSSKLHTVLSVPTTKRVRVPSSILSELYPEMPAPYYQESVFGKSDISLEKEPVQFGETLFAPKYPCYRE